MQSHMKSHTKKVIKMALFWYLYVCIVLASIAGAWNPQNPLIMLIVIAGSLLIWYIILKLLFWIVPQLVVILYEVLLFLLKGLWNFILNRVREFGKALRNEN